MKFRSTRETEPKFVLSAEAIKEGLAPDGGLYLPEEIPTVSLDYITGLAELPYSDRAAEILSLFLTDYDKGLLLEDCRDAYSEARFPGGPAPIHSLSDEGIEVLELWHGPTCAFKDMALQIMPKLLSRSLTMTGEERKALILVATSGDTGKAALEGYRDVPGTGILVFYPVDGVSRVQKLQMQTQEGDNVSVCAIRGNFDDAQNGVKQIFADADVAEKLNSKGVFLSSANSINFGRLAPQIVYYISAYADMVKAGSIEAGEEINICVPTGNFGNIFAAYIAKEMGLPVGKLICASNSNNILTDFIESGVYDRNRKFHTTISPSMDILISSNLERLLSLICGPVSTAEYMASLKNSGKYEIKDRELAEIKKVFCGYYCSEEETGKVIKETFYKNGYLIDTHTAVGLGCAKKYIAESGDKRKLLLASTASPYKFSQDVLASLGHQVPADGLDALTALSEATGTVIPAPLASLRGKTVRFDRTVDRTEMTDTVLGTN